MDNPNEKSTVEKLNEYSAIEKSILSHQDRVHKQAAELQATKDALLKSLLTPEQVAKMDEIELEFQPQFDIIYDPGELKDLEERKQKLADEITKEVLTVKESVSGDQHICVFTAEKSELVTKVNIDMLKGIAVNIPKIKECYTEETKTNPAKAYIRKR